MPGPKTRKIKPTIYKTITTLIAHKEYGDAFIHDIACELGMKYLWLFLSYKKQKELLVSLIYGAVSKLPMEIKNISTYTLSTFKKNDSLLRRPLLWSLVVSYKYGQGSGGHCTRDGLSLLSSEL
jgi:hypothetical protein